MKFTLTGAPGTGKSAVYDDLYIPDFKKVPEISRYWLNFFKEQKLHQFLKNDFFQPFVDVHHINNITRFEPNADVMYDRSLPDQIAYRIRYGLPVTDKLIENCLKYRVDKVFIFPYWEEIYQQDNVRTETKEEAQLLDELILEAYKAVNYEPIIVPKLPILDRIDFILARIDAKPIL
jgi:predicted ATPase